MANLGVFYNGQIVDGLSIPASVSSYLSLPDSATLAQTASALAVWAAAVDGVVDGAFTQVQATITPTLPTGLKPPTGTAWAASEVAKTGLISFSLTGSTNRWSIAAPTLSSSVISAGKIDFSNPDIIALVDLLLNPTGYFTNPNQLSLEAVLDGLITFRKYTQLRKRSMVAK
jgi:hypothetical protein